MNTRGAPAIAITGCLALAVELVNLDFDSVSAFDQFVIEKLGLARNLVLEGLRHASSRHFIRWKRHRVSYVSLS